MRGAAALALALAACAGPPFDAGSLRASQPGLDAEQARALAASQPYLLPAAGRVVWLLCRFDTRLPIPLAVADGASPAEEEAVGAALRALERAGLGVRFGRVAPEEASVLVEFVEGLVSRPDGLDQANTLADCALEPEALADPGAARLGAALDRARVRIGRGGPRDALGRERPLDPDELAGIVLHELAHALGLQGHVRRGLLARGLDGLAGEGRAARAGEATSDPALRGLYALPSGWVLASRPVSPARTQLVDRLARLVEGRAGFEGPFLRVGDAQARVFWRDAQGREYGCLVERLGEVARHPERIVVLPEARTRRALPRERDPRLED
jgi:hypothetical protein